MAAGYRRIVRNSVHRVVVGVEITEEDTNMTGVEAAGNITEMAGLRDTVERQLLTSMARQFRDGNRPGMGAVTHFTRNRFPTEQFECEALYSSRVDNT